MGHGFSADIPVPNTNYQLLIMLQQSLSKLFERDLGRVKTELLAYPDESVMWQVQKQVNNSAGNLARHIAGNLQHFVGTVLNGSDYVRNRTSEFNDKNVPREQVLAELDKTIDAVQASLANLSDEQLAATYPIEVLGYPMTTEHFLLHLSGHLNYHLGQISYHRRLLVNAS